MTLQFCVFDAVREDFPEEEEVLGGIWRVEYEEGRGVRMKPALNPRRVWEAYWGGGAWPFQVYCIMHLWE